MSLRARIPLKFLKLWNLELGGHLDIRYQEHFVDISAKLIFAAEGLQFFPQLLELVSETIQAVIDIPILTGGSRVVVIDHLFSLWPSSDHNRSNRWRSGRVDRSRRENLNSLLMVPFRGEVSRHPSRTEIRSPTSSSAWSCSNTPDGLLKSNSGLRWWRIVANGRHRLDQSSQAVKLGVQSRILRAVGGNLGTESSILVLNVFHLLLEVGTSVVSVRQLEDLKIQYKKSHQNRRNNLDIDQEIPANDA